MTQIQFFSYLRKRVAKKTEKGVIYQYYITIPAKVVEALGLEELVNKKIKVIIEPVED